MNDNGRASKPQLPETLLDILRQAAESDAGWWPVARAMADYIAELPEVIARSARANAIRDAAIARGVQPGTMRDAVHTAETITYLVEDDESLKLLCWQHAVRAARIGDGDKALAILRQVVAESDDHAGQRPPVARVDQLVREANGRKPTKRRRWSGTVVAHIKGRHNQSVIEYEPGEARPGLGMMLTLIEIPESDE